MTGGRVCSWTERPTRGGKGASACPGWPLARQVPALTTGTRSQKTGELGLVGALDTSQGLHAECPAASSQGERPSLFYSDSGEGHSEMGDLYETASRPCVSCGKSGRLLLILRSDNGK